MDLSEPFGCQSLVQTEISQEPGDLAVFALRLPMSGELQATFGLGLRALRTPLLAQAL